jgi:hypothetical protein
MPIPGEDTNYAAGSVTDKAAPAESATIISARSAETAVAGASNETAPEIDLGRFDGILPAQIAQQCVDALVIALDCCARSMQLQDGRENLQRRNRHVVVLFAVQPRSERRAGIRKTLYPFYCSDNVTDRARGIRLTGGARERECALKSFAKSFAAGRTTGIVMSREAPLEPAAE